MKLTKKIILTGKIELKTGLHIGGNKDSMEIGGIDSGVIKTANKVPYIPGSSLKGKLRSLLAKEEGALTIDDESIMLKKLFGYAGKRKANLEADKAQTTRLYIRDANLDIEHFKKEFEKSDSIIDYGEDKVENVIDRKSGTAQHPRHIERVPAGSIFHYELVLNVYEDDEENKNLELIKKAFNLLEDDYLGGSGSRGYGKVSIISNRDDIKALEEYAGV